MSDIELSCECGKVKGLATEMSSKTSMRMVCHCKHCQAFANFLKEDSDTLDQFGGTEVLLMAPARLKITAGEENLRHKKITQRGPYRWYADCCRTPIGNTINPKIPFVTLIHSFVKDEEEKNQSLGPIRAYVNGKESQLDLPRERAKTLPPVTVLANITGKLLLWRLKGLNLPSPFFSESGKIKDYS